MYHGHRHHRLPPHLAILHQTQRQHEPSFWKQLSIILAIEAIFAIIMLLVLMRHMGSAPIPFVSHY